MTDDLVLYGNKGWTSPYVFSAFVTLKEKGLPFRMEVLDLQAGQHRRPEYTEPSSTGRVPALRHGDFWVAESSAIDEYLEEVFPPPAHARLYPADPRQRARVRMVQAFVRSDVLEVRMERSTATLFEGAAAKPLTPAGRAAAERLVAVAGRFLAPGAEHVAGEFTIADADLALLLQRLVHNGDPCPERLAVYAQRVFQRPSVREWLKQTAWRDR
ncbi:glutathione S-transferase domain protein [Anaeromyxobacter sp. K]|uniref:glutathione transferase n=1 Tax=Anaeromyxobacter sp. (strain K) TaxID=447217 RepID=UPI00017BE3E2|nr:glutathione transferase [Anaeromyxobacter sp. K]ACG74695.1 glutathione S-transferase domain protein [Anaeromyxobacter sp. K]